MPIKPSPRHLAIFAILLWTMMVVTSTFGHGQTLTQASAVHAVVLMVQGLGVIALSRAMMLAGMMVERQRLTQVWDGKLFGHAMVHGVGGLLAMLIVPIVTVLASTFA